MSWSYALSRHDATLSADQLVDAVCTEQRVLDFARWATAAHVERRVRAWPRVDRTAAAEDDQRRQRTGSVAFVMVSLRWAVSSEKGCDLSLRRANIPTCLPAPDELRIRREVGDLP